jgi:hypothetical protein
MFKVISKLINVKYTGLVGLNLGRQDLFIYFFHRNPLNERF